MEREVRELNTFLNSFRVELAPAGRKGLGKSKGLSAVADPVRLYRVFNNACWTHVGRFYGGWWQELPKAKRRHLLIDGEAVIELDFRALHPRLCYQMSGQPLGPMDDPYAFPGMKGVAQRNLVKTALNQLINITPIDGLRLNAWETYSYAASKAAIRSFARSASRAAREISAATQAQRASGSEREQRVDGDREEQVVEPLVERQFSLRARLFHRSGAERRACARRDRGEHQTCDDHFVLLVVDGPVGG